MKRVIFSAWLLILCIPAFANEPIRVAAIFSKTGEAYEYTKEFYWGAQLAAEMINQTGGVLGKSLEIIELDNQSTAAGSVAAAREAIRLKVTAVCGAAWSSHSIAMAPILQKAGVPMISPASTNPDVTKIGNYIFRTCFTDSFQGDIMAFFALNDLKSRKAAVLTDVSSDFSMALTSFFIKKYTRSDADLVYTGSYLKSDIDFKPLLTPLKKMQPDVIFLPGYISDSGFIIKQARNMGIQGIFLGTDGWAGAKILYEIAGAALNGIYFTAPRHPLVSRPLAKTYMDAYETKFKADIFPFAPLIYDAFLVLAHAIHEAGSLDQRKIRDALASTRNFEGASGRITFDKNGDPVNKDAVIMAFTENKAVFYKSINVE
jgi:branched-chain amino acid transport system substrate-binding protein